MFESQPKARTTGQGRFPENNIATWREFVCCVIRPTSDADSPQTDRAESGSWPELEAIKQHRVGTDVGIGPNERGRRGVGGENCEPIWAVEVSRGLDRVIRTDLAVDL